MSFSTPAKTNLLALAEAYASATGLSIATISSRFYGQSGFFDRLRDGACTINLDKVDDVLDKFRQEWPTGTPWPKMLPCPMPKIQGKTIRDPGATESRIAHKRGHDARARSD